MIANLEEHQVMHKKQGPNTAPPPPPKKNNVGTLNNETTRTEPSP